MKCMKCGTGIPAGQVFCEECLTDMEKHPVNPGTPVILPHREKNTVAKRSRKRARKPEEIISRLRRAVVLLMALVLVLSLALTTSVYWILTHTNTNSQVQLPGQNYGTSESVD